jgi:hypothetical protein
MFTDDTNVFIANESLEDLFSLINAELIQVVNWLKKITMPVNITNMHFVPFQHRQKVVCSR